MLPAMIPFVLASLVCVCFIAVFPIGVVILAIAGTFSRSVCTDNEHSISYGDGYTLTRSCTYIDSYIDTKASGKMLCMWIASCAIACMYQINQTKTYLLSKHENEYFSFLFINIFRYCHVFDHRFVFSLQIRGRRIQTKPLALANQWHKPITSISAAF